MTDTPWTAEKMDLGGSWSDYEWYIKGCLKEGSPTVIAVLKGEANARLIAAAPELLEACKEAKDFFAQMVTDGDHESTLAVRLAGIGGVFVGGKIIDAIAKAEGHS